MSKPVGTDHPFFGARLKVERAKRHIGELSEEIKAFIAREPYAVIREDDPSTGQRVWKVQEKECVPAAWSGPVGDAIHNARAALDLMMVGIVRYCDPGRVSYNHVHFVIRESKQKFEVALPEKIKGASPEARTIIENLKPYKGGAEAFWRLHQLDILDKHKSIIPVGAAFTHSVHTFDAARMLNEAFGGSRPPFVTGFTIANEKPIFPLQDGTILLAETDIGTSHSAITPFQEEPNFAFEIAFGDGQIIDGKPIVPALTQICEFVEGIFDVFERMLFK